MVRSALQPGAEAVVYASSPLHGLLAPAAERPEGPNIGRNGEHLSVVVLTMQRPEMVARLLSSFVEHVPGFAGEILIADNGSGESDIRAVREMLDACPLRTRLLEFGRNLGVAAGRNAASKAAAGDWLLNLDDDIFLVGNPFPQIQADIAKLGCLFANIRMLDSDQRTAFGDGGHLSIHRSLTLLTIGHGSAHVSSQQAPNAEVPAELGTFLFGASLLNKDAFLAAGGFDEQLFIGFEDTDLSIRLFQSGMKVGAVGPFSFVHDHPKPKTDVAEDYERKRYSRQIIRDAALYMERKHSFAFWTPSLQGWLDQKNQTPLEPRPIGSGEHASPLPAIALVVDVHNWAFANIAWQVRRALSDRFNITIIAAEHYRDEMHLLFALRGFDLVHFLWRPALLQVVVNNQPRATQHKLSLPTLLRDNLGEAALTFGVYDHLFLEQRDWDWLKPIFGLADGYSVSSNKLRTVYSQRDVPPPLAVLSDGVDTRLFAGKARSLPNDRPLAIGWAGNSAWSGKGKDAKGIHSLLRPALTILRNRGLAVEEDFADKLVSMRSHADMPLYYAGVDLYVCASESEGTPNPVLEAMASGLPIVSTDVGIVREVVGPLQSNFVVDSRSPDALANAMERLITDQALYNAISAENLVSIGAWDWLQQAEKFSIFFETAIAHRRSVGTAKRFDLAEQ